MLQCGLADVVDAIEGDGNSRNERANVDDGALRSNKHWTEGLSNFQDGPNVDIKDRLGSGDISVEQCSLVTCRVLA